MSIGGGRVVASFTSDSMLSFGGVTVHPPATTQKNLYFRLTVSDTSRNINIKYCWLFAHSELETPETPGESAQQQITFFNFIIKKPNML